MLEESAQFQTTFFSNESERTSGIWGGVQEHDAGRQGVFANQPGRPKPVSATLPQATDLGENP